MSDQLTVRGPPDLNEPQVEQKTDPKIGEYRYPGVPPFADTDMDRLVFRGRAKEIDQVLHSILSFDLYLIYAVSGLGKTSLLAAGVMEPLRQRDFFPVVLRLNDPNTSPTALIDAQLREAASKVNGITVTRHPSLRDVEGPPASLWDLLSGFEVWRGNELQHLVLIFDQFEELFTLGWSDDQRGQFIEQLGQVIRRHRPLAAAPEAADPTALVPPPDAKIILVIREDSLGELEAMAEHVPQIMRHRFRLDGLARDQAEAAIREPARVSDPRLVTPQFGYSEGAARAILAFLGARQDRGRPVLTGSIDPAQLQIICQHVERSILPNKPLVEAGSVVEISEDDLGGKDGLERILRDFYRRELSTFSPTQRRLVRNLCESGLINQRGRRLSLEEEEIQAKFKLTKPALEDLVARRLLRAEPRVGSVYYELGHDTLAAPILAYREGARRARRRRWLLALAALAAIVLVVALVKATSSTTEKAQSFSGQQVAVPSETTETLEVSGNSDPFVFDAIPNQTLVVDVRPDASLNARLEVTDPQGAVEWADDDIEGGAERLFLPNTVKGRYQVIVSGVQSTYGEFDLSVRPADVVAMAIPDTKSATIGAYRGVSVFSFEGAESQALIVEVKPDASLDAVVEVTNPNGRVARADVAAEAGTESVVVDGTVEGRYLVVVSSFETTAGGFEISIRPSDVAKLTVGGPTMPATIGPANPEGVFSFETTDNQTLMVEVSPKAGIIPDDLALSVTDPNGSIVGDTAYAATESDETVVVEATVPGRYLVVVAEPGFDTTELNVSVRSAELVGMAIGDTKSGSIAPANPVEVFTFDAVDNQTLIVEVKPEVLLDAVVQVIGPNNLQIPNLELGSEGATETIVVGRTVKGRYLVVISGHNIPTGTFELSVTPAQTDQMVIGDREPGTVDPSNPVAVIEFKAPDERALSIEIEPAQEDSIDSVIMMVTAPDGQLYLPDIGDEGNSETVEVDPAVKGRYVVVVSGLESITARFTLSVHTT